MTTCFAHLCINVLVLMAITCVYSSNVTIHCLIKSFPPFTVFKIYLSLDCAIVTAVFLKFEILLRLKLLQLKCLIPNTLLTVRLIL
jgi:hypothetical protein